MHRVGHATGVVLSNVIVRVNRIVVAVPADIDFLAERSVLKAQAPAFLSVLLTHVRKTLSELVVRRKIQLPFFEQRVLAILWLSGGTRLI